MHYLIAAEQGSKEGQASLAWLLDKSMAVPPTESSPFTAMRETWNSLRGMLISSSGSDSGSDSGSSGGGGDTGDTASGGRAEAESDGDGDTCLGNEGEGAGSGYSDARVAESARKRRGGGRRKRRSGIGGVADAVREMGGDPEAMARRYRRLAAEQGDSEARCGKLSDA